MRCRWLATHIRTETASSPMSFPTTAKYQPIFQDENIQLLDDHPSASHLKIPHGVSFHIKVRGFFLQKKPRNRGLVHAWTSQKAAVSCSDRVVEMTGPHSRPVAEVPVHESPPAHRAHSSYSWHRTRLPPTP